MGKTFWILLVGVVAILVGAFLLVREPSDNSSASQTVEDPLEVTDEDHTKGPKDAAVTLIEYGDFQCPHCASAEPKLKQLRQDFQGELRFVYRHFPITSTHPNAQAAAKASEAAARQDDFWAMHDLLFARQQEWSSSRNARETFLGYAEQLGLDMKQYEKDFEAAGSDVDYDRRTGEQLDVGSTPTFFVNGEKVAQNNLRERIQSIIENSSSNGDSSEDSSSGQ
jgi:protein-disulfide isomerase